MTSQSSIMEKKGIIPNETIYITPKCIVHLHGHRNKMAPLMKPFILTNLSNGIKFRHYTY